MKRALFIYILSFSLFLSLPTLIFAQSPLPGSFRERLEELRRQRQELIEQRREELLKRRQEIREGSATRQAQLQQKVVERIKIVFSMILRRYQAALVRLDKIANRIASRIDKLKAKGVNTAAAEAKLAEAERLGAAAGVSIEDAKAKIEAIDASSLAVRDAVKLSREAVRSAKKALFEYHKALAAAIRELKAAKALREGTTSAD